MQRTDSQETPPTPLFDEDISQPLEDFPRIKYEGPGWEMHLRQPNKKKITGQRYAKVLFKAIMKNIFHGKDRDNNFLSRSLKSYRDVITN